MAELSRANDTNATMRAIRDSGCTMQEFAEGMRAFAVAIKARASIAPILDLDQAERTDLEQP